MVRVLELPTKERLREVHPAVHEINMLAAKGLNANHHFELAIIAAKRALRVTPNSRELWVNIGTFFFNMQQYGEAEAAFMRSTLLDPNFAMAFLHLGLVYGATKQFDRAEEFYAIAEKLEPDNLAVKWDRSLLKLRRGDYKAGFAEYEVRIDHKPYAYPKLPAPYYKGGELRDTTVYVMGEQGMGDTILFSRFLPWLFEQGCKIYVHVNAAMTNLLWEYRHLVEFLPDGVPIPQIDYVIPMGSLPHWAGTTLETVPPDPGYIAERVGMAEAFQLPKPQGPDPFRVGIAWTGNPLMDRNEERSIPFKIMARVVENPRVWAHSFQCGPAAADIAKEGADQLILDLSEQLMARGLVGCGAALRQMDLVITSCTSVAHLAGALGVPCWVMLCYDSYWPWLIDRSDSPWYPNTKLFRQQEAGNWASVMDEVLAELDQHLAEKELKYG